MVGLIYPYGRTATPQSHHRYLSGKSLYKEEIFKG